MFMSLGFSQKTNTGTDFWMGFLKNYTGSGNSLRLYISASDNSKVKISIPLQNYIDSIYVPKDSVKVFYVPVSLGYLPELDSIVKRAIHVTSDYPVSLSAMNLISATTDASIVLPTTNIPNSATYVVGTPNSSGFYSLALMVACQDSTLINIVPSALTASGKASGVPYNIRLNKGEMYQLASKPGLLTGTTIKVTSANKLVVFAGNECSNWPCGACDHQYEQIMPNLLVDTSYLIPPHFGHTNGYLNKFVPLDTGTIFTVNGVKFNGKYSPTNPLIVDVKGDSGYYVKSTKPFHAFQFLKGANCNGYITSSYGDPAMLEILSYKYFGNISRFSTVNSTNLKDHFVSIVIRTSAKNIVYFDNSLIPSSEFKEFPANKAFSYACLKITLGQHLVECSDGMLAYCYGIGFAESYLYLAGFNLPNFDLTMKDSVVAYNCKNGTIDINFRGISEKTLKKYTWYFGDNTTATGNPVVHRYMSVGTYTVKVVGEDFSGKKDSVIKTINVNWPNFNPVQNKIICGNDTVKFIEKNPFFANFKWMDSSTFNHNQFWSTTNVWVKATDTSGYCHFVDTGKVGKIDMFTDLRVDSINNCHRYNLFKFSDSTKVLSDQIEHKAWVFPWTTVWDKNITEMHFPMPGKYTVYFDVYTKQVNCKARYPIELTVHPNPDAFTNLNGETFCSGTSVLLKDSSQIITGKIAKVKWEFSDSTSIVSDSLRTYKEFNYLPILGNVIQFYKHIAISGFSCNDTVSSAVVVMPKPLSSFTLSTPDTIKCLPSARWTFNSTTTIALDTYSLKWDAGNGVKGTGSSLKNVRYTSPGKYKVKLLATSTNGCLDSITKTIEVINVPDAQFTIKDTTRCFTDQNFEFKDQSIGKYLSKHWYSTNINNDTGSMIDSVNYNAPGSYTVKLVVKSPIAGCVDSIEKNVMVLKNPDVKFKVNKDTQCLNGNSFDLSNISDFYQSYASSNWTLTGKNVNLNDTNYKITNKNFTDTGLIKVYLKTTDKEGCDDLDSMSIYIQSQALAKLSINDSIQCFNGNRFLFKTDADGNTKTWKVNQSTVQSGKTDSLVYNSIVAGTHQLVLLNNNSGGCSDSISLKFKVLPKPKAEFSIDKDSQCFKYQNFNFASTSQAVNDKIDVYQYTINDTLIKNSATAGNVQFADAGIFNVKLLIKTEEGCKDSITKKITVLAHPEIEIIGDTACLGEDLLIAGKQIKGQTIKTWDWDLGDGSKASSKVLTHQYATSGAYLLSLKVTDIFGCDANTTLISGALVRPLPDAAFYYDIQDYGINQSIVRMRPNVKGYSSYFWRFPNGSNSILDTAFIVVKDQIKGEIWLKVTNTYGCVDSSSNNINHFPNNFNVFIPNAISVNRDLLNDVFKIQGLGGYKEFDLHVYNRWGEEVFYSNDPNIGWDGSYQGMPVQEGVYSYLLKFVFLDGNDYLYSGTLTVLR